MLQQVVYNSASAYIPVYVEPQVHPELRDDTILTPFLAMCIVLHVCGLLESQEYIGAFKKSLWTPQS